MPRFQRPPRAAPRHARSHGDPFARRLRLEPLEDRRLLAAMLVVNSTSDAGDGTITDGVITLREAIEAANATPGHDTITFDTDGPFATFATPERIELEGTELAITDSLTIDGPGEDRLRVYADRKSRVFLVDNGDSGNRIDVELSGLSVGGGLAGNGGGILNRESLTVTASTISYNDARDFNLLGFGGGVYNDGGDLTFTASSIRSNDADFDGGGIFNARGNLTVTASTISGNDADGDGGGIYSIGGNLTVTDSTISWNESQSDGGGIYSNTNLDGNEITTITSSTISSNTAGGSGGGIYNLNGLTAIRSSTITDNTAPSGQGSGVASYGNDLTRTDVQSTIIAGNIGSDVDFVGGSGVDSFVSLGHNLIGMGSATAAFTNDDQTGVADPMLRPQADNDGPTRTHALLPGSPAIDAGADIGLTTDQRGAPYARDVGGGPDIGAYERQTLPSEWFVVDTIEDADDGDHSAGDRSLREALSLAAGSDGVETITFDTAGTFATPQTITLDGTELAITTPLTIDGPGADRLTVDGDGKSRVFRVEGNYTNKIDVEFRGLTITGGQNVSRIAYGGGIYNEYGNLTVTASTISGNYADSGGGGIRSSGGNLIITASTISGNYAESNGGGIYSSGGNLTITASTISGNYAKFDGGGIANSGGNLTITASTISGNRADVQHGGGIWSVTNLNGSRTATITGSTISGNTTNGKGGGIYNLEGLMVIRSSTITDNTAPGGQGSGVASYGDDITRTDVQSTIIAGNNGSDVDRVFGNENTFVSLGHNLVGSGGAVWPFYNDDQRSVTDPMLGPLADNGGPTLTHAVLPGSPALDRVATRVLVRPRSVDATAATTDFSSTYQLINGSGMSGTATIDNYMTIPYTSTYYASWVTDSTGFPGDYFATEVPPVLTFNLGAPMPLTDLVVWGYIDGDDSEASAFSVEFSSDNGNTFSPGPDLTHVQTGSGQETLSLGGTFVADTVRLTVTDNFYTGDGSGGGDRVALGEVRFITNVDPPPLLDQRGVARPQDGDGDGLAVADIGAYELEPPPPDAGVLDVDGSGVVGALSDGLMIIRYLAGFTGNAITDGTIEPGATRDNSAIEAFLNANRDVMDIDGNGMHDALTDGLLAVRYLAGFTGDALISDAVGAGATRTTAPAIEAYLASLLPGAPPPTPADATFAATSGMMAMTASLAEPTPPALSDAVKNDPLQVNVNHAPITGLSQPDVFCFGNPLGDAGVSNLANVVIVDAQDRAAVRENLHDLTNPAPVDSPHDFNRDRLVNAVDRAIELANPAGPLTGILLFTAPGGGAMPGVESSTLGAVSPAAVTTADAGTGALGTLRTAGRLRAEWVDHRCRLVMLPPERAQRGD